MRWTALFLAMCVPMAAAEPDAKRGEMVFQKRCTGCHGLDQVKVGPRLRGVYGRVSGKDGQFSYSDAMKKAQITWDEATLDKWLTDTESLVPDNDMSFRLNNADERADVIAFLKTLSNK